MTGTTIGVPRGLAGKIAAPMLAVAVAAAAMGLGWHGVDWPAQLYRVHLFQSNGWVSFDTGWYGGNVPAAYSTLYPPVAALLGVGFVVVSSTAAAAWAFDRLATAELGAPARVGFALLRRRDGGSGRHRPAFVPSRDGARPRRARGTARPSNATASLLAWRVRWPASSPRSSSCLPRSRSGPPPLGPRGRLRPSSTGSAAAPVLIVALCVSPSRTLPVPGHHARRGPHRVRRRRARDSGRAPHASTRRLRLCRDVGRAVPVPNSDRRQRRPPRHHDGGPAAARRRAPPAVVVAGLVAFLVAWEVAPALGAINIDERDASTSPTYYASLIAEMHRVAPGPTRLEIPLTHEHWETAWVAPTVPSACGLGAPARHRRQSALLPVRFAQPFDVPLLAHGEWRQLGRVAECAARLLRSIRSQAAPSGDAVSQARLARPGLDPLEGGGHDRSGQWSSPAHPARPGRVHDCGPCRRHGRRPHPLLPDLVDRRPRRWKLPHPGPRLVDARAGPASGAHPRCGRGPAPGCGRMLIDRLRGSFTRSSQRRFPTLLEWTTSRPGWPRCGTRPACPPAFSSSSWRSWRSPSPERSSTRSCCRSPDDERKM